MRYLRLTAARLWGVQVFWVSIILGLSCSWLAAYADDDKTKPNNALLWPIVTSAILKGPAIERAITQQLKGMTLEQKVAQMIQPEISFITPDDMRRYGFGSYLMGGSTNLNNDKHAPVTDWLKLADEMYVAAVDDSIDGSTIPALWGIDAVHGHNNVFGATLFPHNIGLGAAFNPALIKKIATATAQAVAATGVDWTFSPTVAVPRDDRWGRTYEGYAEAPALVASYATQMVEGLQGELQFNKNANYKTMATGSVIATAKHFVGDGGTQSGQDRGDTRLTEKTLRTLHAAGYITALEAGVQAIMVSFSSWNGEKLHDHSYLLNDVLKNRLGFDGLVVTDWNGHGQVTGCNNESCAAAINAGVDVVMVPEHWQAFFENTLQQVRKGSITLARIDDAVTRILRVKHRYGVFNKGLPSKRPLAGSFASLNQHSHRALARQAVRESLVLLKNNDGVLPLSPHSHIVVSGDGANNITQQTGGWSLTWSGNDTLNADFPNATSIFIGIKNAVEQAGGKAVLSENGQYTKKPDVAVVVFGEHSYAEWMGDITDLAYGVKAPKPLQILKRFKKAGIPTVAIFISGRALWVNPELNASDAFVAAWLPGTEGAGIADVLFRESDQSIHYDFKGKLAFSWPKFNDQYRLNTGDEKYDPLFAYGYGLSYRVKHEPMALLDETLSKNETQTQPIQPKSLFYKNLADNIQFQMGDKNDWNISMAGTFATTKNSKTVTIKTTNKEQQDDARRITWSGEGKGRAYLVSLAKLDLSRYLAEGAALSFDVRLERLPSTQVYASMGCSDDCKNKVEITQFLKKSALKQWQSISIDLSCFTKEGADLSTASTPWMLETDGQLILSVANIQIIPNKAAVPSIACRK